jgi:hypothetical protein
MHCFHDLGIYDTTSGDPLRINLSAVVTRVSHCTVWVWGVANPTDDGLPIRLISFRKTSPRVIPLLDNLIFQRI